MTPIDLGAIDGVGLLKIAITIAAALGLGSVVIKLGRDVSNAIRRHVLRTPSPYDDKAGRVVADLIDLGVEAAQRGDLDQVMDVIKAAAALPTVKVATPKPGSSLSPSPRR